MKNNFKKSFLFIPTITLPLLITIQMVSCYSSVTSKRIKYNTNSIAQIGVDNYSATMPSWTHYAVGEKLDLRDLKVTYNDPEKGAIDVTNECKLSMQNDQELTQEGEFDVTIQHNEFTNSFKIYVEKEATEVQCDENIEKMGDISVEFRLMSNQECILTDYEDGEGTLQVPDCVERDGIKYFIKQIPSDWSDGENDIEGLEFRCNHLKKICGDAFLGTNCLDYYIDNKYVNGEPNLLEFPEGLEEIGEFAFANTDCGQESIKGYSFPSTLKKIEKNAFGNGAPYIDGDNDNGELCFKSVPEIDYDAFHIISLARHNCKYIYGSTKEIAQANINKLLNNKNFNNSHDFLLPCLLGYKYETVQFDWGDIKVECGLTADECWLNNYISGSGKLIVPDSVEHNGKIYYVKEIPSNWSDGENDITGVDFKKCKHLKKICDHAFENTNCLDYYINHKKELLEFPEGLEEIGEGAFAGTDYGQNKIKGYSFPSTLKLIDNQAFYRAPYIDGDDDNGELHFKSIPEIKKEAFYIAGPLSHKCKIICGETMDIARTIRDKLVSCDDFNYSPGFLIPHLINDKYEISQFTWQDITVECELITDECTLIRYISGSGKIAIPDCVEYNNKIYYVKEIPSNWSDGENNITGIDFKDCKHLKKICDHAFENTNCLDYYINHKKELLEFPEGLEEIGINAFAGTDYGQNKIKGYSFPSTLKKIGFDAFAKAPYIDGDDDNGELWFKSTPTIWDDTFHINGKTKHNCKYIYGSTLDIARTMRNKILLFKNSLSMFESENFNTSKEFLIPRLIGDGYYETIETDFGDIKVKCGLTGDECQIISYVDGKGTVIIPDNIKHNNKTFYIKEIPINWSDGENDITGLEFAKDCRHLKKICDSAFKGTNCLDYYINHKDVLLEFPEGLEEIGSSAFSGTDFGHDSIRGYLFPSTLKEIGEYAFGDNAPFVDGDSDNGELWFKSIPNIDINAFCCSQYSNHSCKYIYASTLDMANKIIKIFNNKSSNFSTLPNFLVPKVIQN